MDLWKVCTNKAPLPQSTPGIIMVIDNGLAYRASRLGSSSFQYAYEE